MNLNQFQKSYHYQNVTLDAERFPALLPERKGFSKLTYFKKEKKLLTPLGHSIVFFEIQN